MNLSFMNRIGTREHQKIFISSNHLLRVIFFFFHLSLFTLSSNGQSAVLTYAHQVIDTLTSPRLDGRGYVDSADRKAALFIRGQMMDQGVQSIGGNYFQTLTTGIPGIKALTMQNWRANLKKEISLN